MNIFSKTEHSSMQRSKFDLSYNKLTSMGMGTLVPVHVQEMLPNDVYHHSIAFMARVAPMVAPIMHKVEIHMHTFFVPYRLVHDEWQKFITGGDKNQDTVVLPKIVFNSQTKTIDQTLTDKNSLLCHLGMPPFHNDEVTGGDYSICALIPRAYQLIYNEYYRDQNLVDDLEIDKSSGTLSEQETEKVLQIRRRAWKKDYFTSALPEPQKGESVLLPLTGTLSAEVDATTEFNNLYKKSLSTGDNIEDGNATFASGNMDSSGNADGSYAVHNHDVNANVEIDLDTVEGSTDINDLREAFAIQRFFEKLARGGSRYVEVLRNFWNARTKDKTLQRPQFLGGMKSPIMISEILQHSATETGKPLGTMGGHGISADSSNSYNFVADEHGVLITIASIMPIPSYSQGVHKMWKRFDRLDYGWPTFAHLGEQPIRLDELYFNPSQGDGGQNAETFGYQSMNAEYRFNQDRYSGDFVDSLDFWHMGRKFDGKPVLNEQFRYLTEDEENELNRVFAVTDAGFAHFWLTVRHNITAERVLPFDAQPGLIDHF